MKKLNILILFLFQGILLFGQLTHLKIPSNEEGLVDVEILSKSTYILAEKWNKKLYKTTDRGKTWTFTIVPTEFPGSTEGINFITEKIGFVKTTELVDGGIYAGGNQIDNLYRTRDGGITWTKVTPSNPDLNASVSAIGSFFFFNEKIGICHFDGSMWRTTDGGDNWENQGTHRENNIAVANEKGIAYFVQARTNHLISDQIVEVFYTNSFGINWQQIDLKDLPIGSGEHKIYLDGTTAYISFDNLLYTFKDGTLQNWIELPFTPFAIGGTNELFLIETTLTSTRPPAIKVELFKSDDLGKTLESVDVVEDGYVYLRNSAFKHQTGVLVGTQGDVLIFQDKTLPIKSTINPESIHIAPNPITKGQIIYLDTDIPLDNKWTIRNSLGQEVSSGILLGREISTAAIAASGIYFLELTAGPRTYIKKIVLK